MSDQSVEFFLVALPGLEDLVAAEVADWFPDLTFKIEHGGVTLAAPLNHAQMFNQALRTPTRILLRVASFRCRDFPKLYKSVAGIEWSRWMDPSSRLEVQASSRVSRLKIKRRIEETCLDGFKAYQKTAGIHAAAGPSARLFVRILNDECTLSLDTSGERLHKRGERVLVGEAPLRETIAAALIQWVGRQDHAAARVQVIDPMMGSGVFLVEAVGRDELSVSREFAGVGLSGELPRWMGQRPPIEGVIGFEREQKVLVAAKRNLQKLGVDIRERDFFTAEPLPPVDPGLHRWIFCNPPYGERLKVDKPLAEYYAELFAASERVVKPDFACFILPAKAVKGKFQLPPAWKVVAKRPFLNGGIPVVAFLFGRR